MSDTDVAKFDRLLPGIQLAVFETVWAAEPRLARIAFRGDGEILQVHFEWKDDPSPDDIAGVEFMMQGVVDVALESRKAVTRFTSGCSTPDGYREVMSDNIFRAIASRHAPWRLNSGH